MFLHRAFGCVHFFEFCTEMENVCHFQIILKKHMKSQESFGEHEQFYYFCIVGSSRLVRITPIPKIRQS